MPIRPLRFRNDAGQWWQRRCKWLGIKRVDPMGRTPSPVRRAGRRRRRHQTAEASAAGWPVEVVLVDAHAPKLPRMAAPEDAGAWNAATGQEWSRRRDSRASLVRSGTSALAVEVGDDQVTGLTRGILGAPGADLRR